MMREIASAELAPARRAPATGARRAVAYESGRICRNKAGRYGLRCAREPVARQIKAVAVKRTAASFMLLAVDH